MRRWTARNLPGARGEIQLMDDGRYHYGEITLGLTAARPPSCGLDLKALTAFAMSILATVLAGTNRSNRKRQRRVARSTDRRRARPRLPSLGCSAASAWCGCAGTPRGRSPRSGRRCSLPGGGSSNRRNSSRDCASRVRIRSLAAASRSAHAQCSSEDKIRSRMTRSSCHSRRTSESSGERARATRDR